MHDMSVISRNSPKVLLWEVRAAALSGPTGEMVTSVLLEESLLPVAAVSVCGVKFPGASEEAWLFLGVWTITSSLETTVEKSTWFWSKVIFSVWGCSVLLSSQWFFTAAETIGKWSSEDLLASEKRSKPSEKVYEQIYQEKWIQGEWSHLSFFQQ